MAVDGFCGQSLATEAHAVGDTRERVSRWMQEAPSFLEMVAHVVDDRQRAFDAADAARARVRSAARRAGVGARGDRRVAARPGRDRATCWPTCSVEPATRFAACARPRAPPQSRPLRPSPPRRCRPSAPRLWPPSRRCRPPSARPLRPSSPLGPSAERAQAPAAPSAAHEPGPIAAPTAARPPAAAGTRRILLVDDDANFRNVMMEYLEGFRGYDLRVAVNGEEGLAALADAVPDIVLLDLMMPGIGGMATLGQMKTEYPDLPVVMVTANEDLSLARKALSLGACDYVTKPFDLDYLDAVLNIYLAKTDPRRERELEVLAGVDGGGAVTTVTRTIKSNFSRR